LSPLYFALSFTTNQGFSPNCSLTILPEAFVFPLAVKNIQIRIYRITILPVGLYWYETWFFMLKEEHALKVFENRVLRKIFGHRSERVRGGWRK